MSSAYTTDFKICPENSLYLDPRCKTSIFQGVSTREYPNFELINGFLNHGKGISYHNIARYKCVPYKTEQNLISAYLARKDPASGCIQTKWKLPTHGWGRIQPEGYSSLSVMHRPTRHALCELNYLDFDIVNCHPAFLVDMLKRDCMKPSNLCCSALSEYVSNSKNIREQIMAHYGVSKDVAKQLPISILNGGSFKKWKSTNGVSVDIDLSIVKDLEKQMKPIIERVWRDNPQINIDLLNSKSTGNKVEDYCNKSEKERMRTVMATWAQGVEKCIQERAISAVIQEYGIPIEEVIPCQDGFMLLAKGGVNPDEVIALAESVVKNDFNLSVKWVVKPFDEADRTIPAEAELSIGKPVGTVAFDNDRACAEHILASLTKTLKYCKGRFFMRGSNHVWTDDSEQIKHDLLRIVLESNIYRPGREEGVYTPYTQNQQSAKNVCGAMMALASGKEDYNFEAKLFHSSLGYTLFQNGYLNWRTGYFIPHGHEEFDDSIFFTAIIPYDFTILTNTPEEADQLKANIESIEDTFFYTPFGVEMGDYYILNIARGLAGDCMKRFLFGVGPSNTGKSLITSAIKSACGGYYGGFNASNITAKFSTQDEGQLMRWALLLRTKRIIVSNEIKKGTPLDGNIIKKLSNGGLDDLTGRMHGGNETNFKVAFLPICFANDLDSIKPYDDAVVHRVRAIPYKKVCVDKPESEIDPRYEILRDTTLMEEIETPEFKMAFISTLLKAYMRFCAGGRLEAEPAGALTACAETFGENRQIMDQFLEEYEFTGDEADYVPSSEIKAWLEGTKSDVSATKLASEMKRHCETHGIEGVFNKCKKIAGKSLMTWFGVRRIPLDGDD